MDRGKALISKIGMVSPYFRLEPSHCRSELGDLVQDRVYGTANPLLADDFGVLLTSGSIEPHLARDRAAQEQWLRAHPLAVEDIRGVIRERKAAGKGRG